MMHPTRGWRRIGGMACAVLLGLLATAGWADAPIDLSKGGLEAWRGTGDWQIVGGAALSAEDGSRLRGLPGQAVLLNGPAGRTVDLLSRQEHGDVAAQVEFMIPRGSNSGVYLQGRYEIQIFDSFGKENPGYSDCGGIYQRWANNQGFEGRAPSVNAARQPGAWQTFEIVFRAPRFDARGGKVENARFVRVVHNGQVIHENVEVTGPTRAAAFSDEKPLGPLMLQGDHGPVAFRRIELRPVQLD